MREPNQSESNIEVRVYGEATRPALVYLPGLHGDWTLVTRFRNALAGRVRFVEMTYPRTLSWSLEDYAAAVEEILGRHGISRGWLLAESFSSQVAWPMVARKRFQAEGVILAGGFVRHPAMWGVRMAGWICGGLPLSLIVGVLFGYHRLARRRCRGNPQALRSVDEFFARRTELDRQAAAHRLRLIARNDPSDITRQTDVPIYAISGRFDPVVPWWWVRSWLRKNCRNLRDYKIIREADHTVLSTGAQSAADQIVNWITGATS